MNRQVLLLNASYEPICVISTQRAVVLVVSGGAEMVEAYPSVIRSPSMEIAAPSVVRLVRYVHIPRFRKAYLSRRAILSRDGHECAYCGDRATTMDHVVPRSKGGRHTWENIVACCYACNQRKGDRSLAELGWKLRYQPTTPDGAKRMLLTRNVEPSWETWLGEAVA